MSLFTNPSPLAYTPNSSVEVQQRWLQQQPVQPQQPNLDNNPYTNAVNELNACPVTLRNEIMHDPEYLEVQQQVESLFLQHLYAQILPTVLQNQQYNFLLEKYLQTVKSLKEKHEEQERIREQQAIQAQEQINLLMQDPVISRRLLELQSNVPAETVEQEPERAENKRDLKKGDK